MSGEFGRGYARARMWAQYADNHRGVCLLFDRAALEKLVRPTLTELGEVFSGSVDYRDEGIPTRATWYDLNAVHRDGIDASLDELVRDHWTFSRSDGGTASP